MAADVRAPPAELAVADAFLPAVDGAAMVPSCGKAALASFGLADGDEKTLVDIPFPSADAFGVLLLARCSSSPSAVISTATWPLDDQSGLRVTAACCDAPAVLEAPLLSVAVACW